MVWFKRRISHGPNLMQMKEIYCCQMVSQIKKAKLKIVVSNHFQSGLKN